MATVTVVCPLCEEHLAARLPSEPPPATLDALDSAVGHEINATLLAHWVADCARLRGAQADTAVALVH